MAEPRLNKIASKVILLQTSPTGEVTPVTLYGKKKKKKKSSPPLRGPESVMKRLTDAQKTFADTFANRFKSSRKKKSNGWLLDLGNNVFKAMNKSGKKLRLDSMPS